MKLALCGLDPRVLAIGHQAVRHNQELTGLWDQDHNAALLASLHLGCCAFAQPTEVVLPAQRVVFSHLPITLQGEQEGLNVLDLELTGLQIKGSHLSNTWSNWLSSIGFEVLQVG